MNGFGYGFLALDIVALILLVVYVLSQAKKGFRSGLFNTIISACLVACFFIFITPFSKRIADTKIKISDTNSDLVIETSLNEATKMYVRNILEIDESQSTEKTDELVVAVAQVAVRCIAYVVGIVVLVVAILVARLIVLILRSIIGTAKKKKGKVLGGVFGALRFCMFFAVCILPLYGLLTFTTNVYKDMVELDVIGPSETKALSKTAAVEVNADALSFMDEITKGYDASLTKKYFITPISGLFLKNGETFDEKFISAALTIETKDGEKVDVYDEYHELKPCIPVLLKFSNIAKTGSFSLNDLSEDDLTKLSNYLKESKLLPIVMPAACEIVSIKNDPEKSGFTIDKDAVSNINWENEFEIYSLILSDTTNYLDVTINFKNTQDIISNDRAIELFKMVLTHLNDSDAFTEVVYPLVLNKALDQIDTTKYPYLDIDSLRTINFKEEGKSIIDFAFDSLDSLKDLNVDKDNYLVMLNDPNTATAIKTILINAKEVNVITEKVLPFMVNYYLQKEQVKNSNLTYDLSALSSYDYKANLDALADFVYNALSEYQGLNVDPSNIKSVLKNTDLANALENVSNDALGVPLIKDYFVPIAAMKLIDKIETNSTAQTLGIDCDKLRTYNYGDNLTTLVQFVKEALNGYQTLNFDKENPFAVIDNENFDTISDSIITAALNSDIISNEVLPPVQKYIAKIIKEQNMNLPFDSSLIIDPIEKADTYTLFNEDFDILIDIVKQCKTEGILDNTADLTNKDTLNKTIDIYEKLFELSYIKENAQTYVEKTIDLIKLDVTLGNYGVELKHTNVTDWNKENKQLITIMRDMTSLFGDYNTADFSTLLKDLDDEKKETVCKLISDIDGLDMVDDSSMFVLTKNLVSEFDSRFVLNLTAKDKLEINNRNEATHDAWYHETKVLLGVIEEAEDIMNISDDYQSISKEDASKIKAMVSTATEGVIASRIVETSLKEILPTSVEITVYKNTDCPDVVYNAIILGSTMKDPSSIDLNNTEEVNQLLDSIKGLGVNNSSTSAIDLSTALVNDIAGKDVVDVADKTTMSNAANVLQDAITEYQNSTNQADFDASSLSEETRTKLENNDLAKAIFEQLIG